MRAGRVFPRIRWPGSGHPRRRTERGDPAKALQRSIESVAPSRASGAEELVDRDRVAELYADVHAILIDVGRGDGAGGGRDGAARALQEVRVAGDAGDVAGELIASLERDR